MDASVKLGSRPAVADRLRFHRLQIQDMEAVRRAIRRHGGLYRTCDFTIGGIFMWTDYFRYHYAMVGATCFVMGLNEKDLSRVAFSLPFGEMDLKQSLPILMAHCRRTGIGCELSAVPEAALADIESVAPIADIEPLENWSDYIYDINSLATLSGKKYGKKRNHVNQFMSQHPDFDFQPITAANIDIVGDFFSRQQLAEGKSLTADFERLQVLEVLRHPEWFGFEGAVLTVPDAGVVAFAMGEVVGDTLYVHIEKMDHTVDGSGEAINKLFAAAMLERHPLLRYVNREEDTGDPGLRRAKESYHPAALLKKCNVRMKIKA